MGPIQTYKCERLVEKDIVVFRESYFKTVRYDLHDDIIVSKLKHTDVLFTITDEILRKANSSTCPAKNTSAGLEDACCNIICYKDKIALTITLCQQQPRISMKAWSIISRWDGQINTAKIVKTFDGESNNPFQRIFWIKRCLAKKFCWDEKCPTSLYWWW